MTAVVRENEGNDRHLNRLDDGAEANKGIEGKMAAARPKQCNNELPLSENVTA
jgi:hypothetical protein